MKENAASGSKLKHTRELFRGKGLEGVGKMPQIVTFQYRKHVDLFAMARVNAPFNGGPAILPGLRFQRCPLS
jgi:hypothetical protein